MKSNSQHKKFYELITEIIAYSSKVQPLEQRCNSIKHINITK